MAESLQELDANFVKHLVSRDLRSMNDSYRCHDDRRLSSSWTPCKFAEESDAIVMPGTSVEKMVEKLRHSEGSTRIVIGILGRSHVKLIRFGSEGLDFPYSICHLRFRFRWVF